VTSVDTNGALAIRDERGRLLPGAKIGIGNRGQRHHAEIRRSLINAETPEDVHKVGQELLAIAHSRRINVRTRLLAMRIWLDHVLGKPRVAPEMTDDDDSEISVDDIMTTVINVLEQFDNGVEIKVRMAQAFHWLEAGCRDAQEAVRIAMSEPYPYAHARSDATQRGRAEACESQGDESHGSALVGSSVDAVHGF
jgi:hypothetical protein